MIGKEVEVDQIIKDPKICFMSNYPPKECGISIFAENLTNSMNRAFNPKLRSRVIALNDPETHHKYNNKVIYQITRNSKEDYERTARELNESPDQRLICIQHEFGLFGGEYGSDILYFLNAIKKPVAITFHSVLSHPDKERRKIVRQIAAKVSAIIVMAEAAIDILNKDYGVERSKMYLIHHGTPNVKFSPPDQYKKKIGFEGRTVIFSFGLLSRGKGIEYMIMALPPLVKKYPDLLYFISGETHPNVRREEGESYRNELIALVKELGLEKYVKFQDRYVDVKELADPYILACDIYAFTNLEKEQITSGTLAYALSCGRPVVATPVIYAKELLAQDRGIVIKKTKSPEEFTKALDKLLSDIELRKNMSEAAYAFGRQMIWSNVARRHLSVFNRVVKLREEITKKYPKIKLSHLRNLTDNFGCLQFCKAAVPDKKSGYTLDDNTRALIIATLHNSLTESDLSFKLAKKYLKFIEHAQSEEGYFNNIFMNKNKLIGERSDDAFGRAIWALGYTTHTTKDKELLNKAEDLFDKSIPRILELDSLRAKAFSIVGLYYHYEKFGRKRDLNLIRNLADSLVELYKKNSSNEWQWFENHLSYANAKLSEAMFLAYKSTKNEAYLEIAESTLHFLSDIVFVDDELHPIGQNGWYNKNGKRAFFDQQPIDAFSMVSAYLAAFLATEDKHYHEKAVLAFNWFLGRNHLKQMLYDEVTGGCYDGLGKHSLNLNQGAESTIAYLLSRLMLEEIKKESQDI
ncbi:MAG: glycosyltransferase [Nanoarchaeota archaeon]|nr:glycosyltransferase [Nanoarchaeota archaeon]MBU1027606.1 glycosyltransferase [Nanoarchaeota archaeon]